MLHIASNLLSAKFNITALAIGTPHFIVIIL